MRSHPRTRCDRTRGPDAIAPEDPMRSYPRTRRLLCLPDEIPDVDLAGPYDPRVDTAQVQLAADGGVHELHRVDAEARHELRAASVRLRRHLDQCGSDGQGRARRQVGAAEIEIDEQLIAGEGPPMWRLRDERHRARVHDVQLHLRMRSAVNAPAAAAAGPAVADQPLLHIQPRAPADFPRAHRRPA